MIINSSFLNNEDNIKKIPEDNWSIVSDETDIWDGALPFNTGDKFPTNKIKERASISKTNNLIYNNRLEEIAFDILSIYPEIDPMYGWQVREIIAKLPYFKNATNAWVGLVAGDAPSVDVSEDTVDQAIDFLLEQSNFDSFIQNEVRSRFMDVISAYRVDVDINGRPSIIYINSKNLIVFVNKKYINSIEVVVVWGVYEDQGQKYIDFVEYHYNGYIKKTTYEYNNEIIGDKVNEEEDEAFGGKYKVSPIVVFKHNVMNENDIYGTDQYRYWSSSMLAGMREMQNMLRLAEKTREMIRKVPESAIQKNPGDGSSVFMNKGTISYTENGEGNSPDIEYVVPEIRMNEIVEALDKAINQIGLDTQLGTAFFNLSSLGSKLSAESIRAALLPARLEAKRITTEMNGSVKELIVKLGLLAGIEIDQSKMSLTFYDGFPRDEIEDVKAIQMRLESKHPSISLEDAIMKLDHVSLRVAKQKAAEIRASQKINDIVENVVVPENQHLNDNNSDFDNKVEDLINENNINVTAGSDSNEQDADIQVDNTVWSSQFVTEPRDIPQGDIK